MGVGSSVQEISPSELDFTTVDKAAEHKVIDVINDSSSSAENSETKTEESFNGIGGADISLAFKEKGQAVEVFPQNIDVVPGPSTGVVKNRTILNYCVFIDIVKSLNKSGGVTFEDINMYMAEKNIPKNTKQIKYYLYRGVRNRDLKKYIRDGKKIYKINEKRHIIGIKNPSNEVEKFQETVRKMYPTAANKENVEKILQLIKHIIKVKTTDRPEIGEILILILKFTFLKDFGEQLIEDIIWNDNASLKKLHCEMQNIDFENKSSDGFGNKKKGYIAVLADQIIFHQSDRYVKEQQSQISVQANLRNNILSNTGVQTKEKQRINQC